MFDQEVSDYAKSKVSKQDYAPLSNKAITAMTTGGFVIPPLVRMIMQKRFELNKNMIPASLFGGIGSYIMATSFNKMMEEKDRSKRAEQIDAMNRKINVVPHVITSMDFINKQASYAAAGRVAATVGKYALGGIKDLARGLVSPIKGKTIPETALSVGSKAVAAYGAYSAGKYVYNKAKTPNYTNYLRNQVLAGNIKPEQIDPADMESVRKLGI